MDFQGRCIVRPSPRAHPAAGRPCSFRSHRAACCISRLTRALTLWMEASALLLTLPVLWNVPVSVAIHCLSASVTCAGWACLDAAVPCLRPENPCGYCFQLPSQASTAKLGRRIWDPLAVRAGQCWALQAMGTALLFLVNNTLLGVVCRGRPRRFPDACSVGFASKGPPSICTLHLAVHYQMPIPESSWRSLHIAGAHTATLRRYSRCYPCNVDL